MKKRLFIGLSIALVLVFATQTSNVQAQSGQNEVLYLVDSAGTNDKTSHIYQVGLNGGQATLTLLVTLGPGAAGAGDPGWNNVDVLAATPDGKYLYFIDNSSSLPDTHRLGRYDIATDTVEDLGVIVPSNFNTDQGAIAPDGTFYITRNEPAFESLYYIDLTATPTVILIAQIKDIATGLKINVQGGDIAFGADGTLYMVTSKPPMTLYLLTNYDPDTRNLANPVYAELKGACLPSGTSFNGLAVRDNGYGDLVASSPQYDDIRVLSKNDCSSTLPYPVYLDSTSFDVHNGDMTTGPLMLCTRTIGYWKNHSWDGAIVHINSDEINEEAGRSNPVDKKPGTGFLWQARGNNFSMLYAQLIAAKLNCGDCSIGLIQEAEDFLLTEGITKINFGEEFANKNQKKEATKLAEALDAFNNQYPCEED